ncbi:MAG TPA: DUF6702 family protein [Bacteroidales bacterium]|nr:DUF6702 family protein [Bacteroidales bacterium]
MSFLPSLILTAAVWMHPLHVAYTNIEINEQQKSISVTHKMYTNDFTLLFFHLFEKNIIPVDSADFRPSEIDLINHYMKYRFFLVADNDTLKLDYKGKQLDDEYIWLTFSGKFDTVPQANLEINDMLLLDLFMDQTNLVIVNNGPVEKGFSFNWDNRQSVLALKE